MRITLLPIAPILGCSRPPAPEAAAPAPVAAVDAPAWVKAGLGIIDNRFVGVGWSEAKGPLGREIAENRARAELAPVFEGFSYSLIRA